MILNQLCHADHLINPSLTSNVKKLAKELTEKSGSAGIDYLISESTSFSNLTFS